MKIIDELIAVNLKLISETKDNNLLYVNFINEDGRPLVNSDQYALAMEKEGLIKIDPNKKWQCDLTEFGSQMIKNGGWLKFATKRQEAEDLKLKEIKERKALERKNKDLENKKIELSKLIEKQDSEISELSNINLTLKRKQMKMLILFSVASFVVGAILMYLFMF